ncbi:hypothetical protein JR064_22345 [Xanthomonas sp. CFBP 8703]|uniref:Conjugal transfer protein TraR n=1 Tax=Xanthomonas bonasiae TaxID=2810351 RepID=A0ABS3B8G8_9XANT|nr:hypothetical protein [Xanthomonas bonasiae]MBN6104908.1 hypothetical protein [Xanthomonas bonasiae]
MKSENDINIVNAKAKDDRLLKLERKFDAAIAAKAPSVERIFAQAYELIERGISSGLLQKEIIELVNSTCGLKLHAASFRDLLQKERAAREAGGRPATCPTCGHVLAPKHTKPRNDAANVTTDDQQEAA